MTTQSGIVLQKVDQISREAEKQVFHSVSKTKKLLAGPEDYRGFCESPVHCTGRSNMTHSGAVCTHTTEQMKQACTSFAQTQTSKHAICKTHQTVVDSA